MVKFMAVLTSIAGYGLSSVSAVVIGVTKAKNELGVAVLTPAVVDTVEIRRMQRKSEVWVAVVKIMGNRGGATEVIATRPAIAQLA